MSISILSLSFSYFFISLLGILIATYTDLKDRIIPNKLTYALIFLGIALHALESFTVSSFWPLLTSIALAAVTFAFSWLLWKAGVWAGGDVKLFTGIAALLPFNPNILAGLGIQIPLFASIGIPIFPLTLFLFSIFAALPYGVIISLQALSGKPELRKQVLQDFRKRFYQTFVVAAAIVGLGAIFELFSITSWLLLPLLIAFGFVPKKPRLVLTLAFLATAVCLNQATAVYDFATLYILFILLYSLIKLFLVSRTALKNEIKITQLEEGTIPAETILLEKGKLSRFEGVSIKRIINNIRTNKLQKILNELNPAGREIVSARKARGVTEKEIKELCLMVKEGRLENRISVKQSMAFVPTVLIAFIALNIVGDIVWNIIL